MYSYTLFELRRTLRNPRFLVMTMFMPVAMNIVFVQLNGSRMAPDRLGMFASGYMMSMASFATVSACLSSAGHRLAQERGSGWFSYLTLTPLRPFDIIVGKTASAIALGVPAVLGVFASGVLVNHVPFELGKLALALLIVVLGSSAFAALGVVIGLVTRPETSYAAAMTGLMFFAIVGGLWMPRETLPAWMGSITDLTPSYQIAATSNQVMNGLHGIPTKAAAVFATWTAVFLGLALVGFRRSAASR